MASAPGLPPLPHFYVHTEQSCLGLLWKAWLKRFETFCVASDIKNTTRKRALLLYLAEPNLMDIFETLAETGDDSDYKTADEKLTEHFAPHKNTEFQRYCFRQSRQAESETMDEFHTRSRKLAENCDFHDVDAEIKSQIISNGKSKKIINKALRDPSYTLKQMLEDGHKSEAAGLQTQVTTQKMQATSLETYNLNRVQTKAKHKYAVRQDHSGKKESTCRRCVYNWPHLKSPCPAQGKQCGKCGKFNHFQKCCKSKPKLKARESRKIQYVKEMHTPKP